MVDFIQEESRVCMSERTKEDFAKEILMPSIYLYRQLLNLEIDTQYLRNLPPDEIPLIGKVFKQSQMPFSNQSVLYPYCDTVSEFEIVAVALVLGGSFRDEIRIVEKEVPQIADPLAKAIIERIVWNVRLIALNANLLNDLDNVSRKEQIIKILKSPLCYIKDDECFAESTHAPDERYNQYIQSLKEFTLSQYRLSRYIPPEATILFNIS